MIGITIGTRFYERELGAAALPRPCPNCGRGEGTARRTWMAPIMMGIPLLVHGAEVHYRCSWCGTGMVGPAPQGAPPIPLRQRFGIVFTLGFVLALYGVWFVVDHAVTYVNRLRYEADMSEAAKQAPSGAATDTPAAKLALARTHAEAALKGAEKSKEACMSRMLAKDPKGASDAPFWTRKKIDTTPSASLARTPYYGYASLPAERDNAQSVGGFACAVPGVTELEAALAGASADDLEARARDVDAAVAAWKDPTTVVVSHGGCKTDAKWCRVGFSWVDVESKTVRAAVTEDFPWTGEDGNEPGAKAAMERLRARVAAWKGGLP